MIQFFTVVTTNYLPFAVSLLDSVKKYHPEFEVCICVADYISPDVIAKNSLMGRHPMLQLHEIEAEEFDFITTTYNSMQLAIASKILFARHFLDQDNVDQVIYADSDMLFFNRLPEHIITEHDIIFTPHFSTAPPLWMKRQELEVLNAGLINVGFYKLRKSAETDKFITWYRERSVKDCIKDFVAGYYFEQLWLNFVPLYFKDTFLDKGFGLNMAYWNLHERTLSEADGRFMVNDTIPLIFFHYSGWDYNDPLNISRWALITSAMRPDIIPVLQAYHETLQRNEYESYINLPNFYTANNQSKKKSFFKKLKHKLFKKKK